MPELVFAQLDHAFGKSEPDEEIQDLLKASVGTNLGVHFLSSAITFDPVATFVASELAAKIVWLDAFIMNVDRTVKNTNMLVWNKELWLIDHGAALYFHHQMEHWQQLVLSPFQAINKHVLLFHAKKIHAIDSWAKSILNETVFKELVALIPDEWLEGDEIPIIEKRAIYLQFLTQRLANSELFVQTIFDYEQKASI